MYSRGCSEGDQESGSSSGPWLGHRYQRLWTACKLSYKPGIIARRFTFKDTKDVQNGVRQFSA